MEVGHACLPALSRAAEPLGGAVHGSEADTLDSISGAQAYDGKTRQGAKTFPNQLSSTGSQELGDSDEEMRTEKSGARPNLLCGPTLESRDYRLIITF